MKKLIIAIAFLLLGSSWVNAQAQTAEPPNNMTEIAAYSVFASNYRNKEYKRALKYGRWILKSMPKEIEGYPSFDLAKNLGRFVKIYKQLAEEADDPSTKSAYIDTVQTIYNEVFETFDKDEIYLFAWKIGQGRFYQDNADIIGDDAEQMAMDAYAKAFELDAEKLATSYEGYYLKILLRDLANKETDEAQKKAISIMKEAEEYANDDLNDYFDRIRDKLFDEPEERIAYLEQKLKKDPKNIDVIEQLRDQYKDQGNTKKVQKLNKRLYKLDPSYQNIIALAKFASSNDNYKQSVKYLKEAIDKTDDAEKLKTIYYNIADAQLNLGELKQAANYAKKAINEAPEWGRPYLKLAVIYARAVRKCTQNRDLTKNDRAVYWVVVDYVKKGKEVDSSVAKRANTLLESYRPVTPSSQDVFFSDKWEKGNQIKASSLGKCYSWINETTTVR
ncbi:MAG TPA: hypothetical protein VK106_01405 [Balneolaceae bacterium]|nr:hypothetical protein [Balneolaceae bacterium]